MKFFSWIRGAHQLKTYLIQSLRIIILYFHRTLIIYLSYRKDGNLEIYVVSTSGNFLKNISNNDRGDFDHKFVDDFIK